MNYVVCKKMSGTRDHHVKRSKPISQKQVSYVFLSHVELRGKQYMKVKGGHKNRVNDGEYGGCILYS
jgi:hypothetical protein